MSGLVTPALVVDLATFDDNVTAARALVERTGTVLRPHFKTHRTVALARRQLGPGAPGLTCATVGEVEVLAAHGVGEEILLANEVVSADKIRRLAAVATRTRLTVAVDSPVALAALGAAACGAGASVEVLVDVDVGLGRCGVGTDEEAVRLAAAVVATPGVELAGIMGYEGRIRTDADRRGRMAPAYDRLGVLADRLARAGLACPRVSAAGTSSLLAALTHPAVTEVQAGSYALMEPELADHGLPFRCAARVVATVISRRGARTVVDAGRKAVGCENGLPVPLEDRARTVSISEEHAVLDWDGEPPPLGSAVDLRPTQVRTTFNLYDLVWLWDGHGHRPARVDARGASS